jgi:hypothetical protein
VSEIKTLTIHNHKGTKSMTENYLIRIPDDFSANYDGCPIAPTYLELLPTGRARWDHYNEEVGEGQLVDFEELHDVTVEDLIVALREDHEGEDADALALFARGPVRVFALERDGDFTLRAEGEYLPDGSMIVGGGVVTSLGIHVEWGEAISGLCRGLDYHHLVDRGLDGENTRESLNKRPTWADSPIGDPQDYKRRVRALIASGTLTEAKWEEILGALFNAAEGLEGLPLLDAAVGAEEEE